MKLHSCLSRVRSGDQIELKRTTIYNSAIPVLEKFLVVGYFDLRNGAKNIPVIGTSDENTKIGFYFPDSVLTNHKNFPFRYCLPIHSIYLFNEIVKVYRKFVG